MHTLHVDEVVASPGHLTGECRRRMEVRPAWVGGKSSDGESPLLLIGQKSTAQVRCEYRDTKAPGGHSSGHLVDMRLDPSEERRKAGRHHGDS